VERRSGGERRGGCGGLKAVRRCGVVIIKIIIASHEDEMNDKYNDKLCTSNKVIQ